MASKTVNIAPMIVLGIVVLFTYAVGATTSNAYEQEIQRLASPNVVALKGSVFCDVRSENQFSGSVYFLPGALVSVDCNITGNRKLKSTNGIISVEGETDKNGEFRVELPIIHNINPRRSCSVRLLSSPLDACDIPSISASTQLTLSSSNSNGIQAYVFNPLSYRPSKKQQLQVFISSLPRRRGLEDSTSKTSSPPLSSIPQLPNIPPLPKLSFPPLPTVSSPNIPNITTPPLPKLSVPPLPSAPMLPNLSVPHLTSAPPLLELNVPPLPSAPTLPNLSVPPLPITPTLPKLSAPPLPNAPTLPKLNIPPLPLAPILPNPNTPPFSNSPPLNNLNAPPLPKLSFSPSPPFTFPFSQPPLPFVKFPPFPLFTPPPPSTKDQSP